MAHSLELGASTLAYLPVEVFDSVEGYDHPSGRHVHYVHPWIRETGSDLRGDDCSIQEQQHSDTEGSCLLL
jgi:hypothetical protein